jgi:hypothetical protein
MNDYLKGPGLNKNLTRTAGTVKNKKVKDRSSNDELEIPPNSDTIWGTEKNTEHQ